MKKKNKDTPYIAKRRAKRDKIRKNQELFPIGSRAKIEYQDDMETIVIVTGEYFAKGAKYSLAIVALEIDGNLSDYRKNVSWDRLSKL